MPSWTRTRRGARASTASPTKFAPSKPCATSCAARRCGWQARTATATPTRTCRPTSTRSALAIIKRQYDEMVKYATALRLGTAEAEAILRRFTRENVQHPTYKALAELGKAVKTCFLCRYLADEAPRREVNDGLNVVEQWNSANDFIFFARRGELSSNRAEDHELSMLSLHLLQNCMVYVNTLMLQQVLARPHWANQLTPRDRHALTPLIWEHVNPYGRYELDMDSRIAALA